MITSYASTSFTVGVPAIAPRAEMPRGRRLGIGRRPAHEQGAVDAITSRDGARAVCLATEDVLVHTMPVVGIAAFSVAAVLPDETVTRVHRRRGVLVVSRELFAHPSYFGRAARTPAIWGRVGGSARGGENPDPSDGDDEQGHNPAHALRLAGAWAGGAGSQATSIIIRSLALQEVRLRDWWRVAARELASGLTLGLLLGGIGFMRIYIWARVFHLYGPYHLLVGTAVSLSLVGVVLYGNLVGSMLPFILQRVGFDPAKASAPFVATLVDVSGLIIYFTVAKAIFTGTLL